MNLLEKVDFKTSWQIHEGYDLFQISGKDHIETWQDLYKWKCQDSFKKVEGKALKKQNKNSKRENGKWIAIS